ncbi:regulator of phospholipase D Srf1p [Monosporozyma servazzii]
MHEANPTQEVPSNNSMERTAGSLSPLSPTNRETFSNNATIHSNESNNDSSGSDHTSQSNFSTEENTKIYDPELTQNEKKKNIKMDKKKPLQHPSKRPISKKNDNILPTKRRQLYTNTIFPSTVPPFVADEIYWNKKKESIEEEGTPRETNDDRNELESDMKWSKLAQNIGTSYNYFPNQMVPIFDRRNSVVGIKDNYSIISSSKKSITSSMFSMDDIYNEDEKKRIQNEILSDLNPDWKGDERLEKMLNFKNANYSFQNEEEEKKWKEYLPRLFEQVYSGKGPERADNERNGLNALNNKEQEGMMSQFESETEKWRSHFDDTVIKWKPIFTDFVDNTRRLPLAFRVIILFFSLISLGLAVRIFQNSRNFSNELQNSIPQQASTIMTICVNSIASIYTIYIAQDEFKSAPIGLRNILDKLKLIILDLLFIIFSSANLALAFNTRYDQRWVCNSYYPLDLKGTVSEVNPSVPHICRKQEALSAFLFILVFSWVCCVILSLVRIVRRPITQ